MAAEFSDSLETPVKGKRDINSYFRQDSEFQIPSESSESFRENSHESRFKDITFVRSRSIEKVTRNRQSEITRNREKVNRSNENNTCTEELRSHGFVHIHSFGELNIQNNLKKKQHHCAAIERSLNSFDGVQQEKVHLELKTRRLDTVEDNMVLLKFEQKRSKNIIDTVPSYHKDEICSDETRECDFILISEKISVLSNNTDGYSNERMALSRNDGATTLVNKLVGSGEHLTSSERSIPSSSGKRKKKSDRIHTCISAFSCSRSPVTGVCALNGSVFTIAAQSRYVKVFDYHGVAIDKIDMKAEIDSIAITDTKLYVSCTQDKSIKVLDEHLKLRLFALTPFYVRGIAIHPVNKNVIACMTSSPEYSGSKRISNVNCLMQFCTSSRNFNRGQKINRYNCFCYPIRVSVTGSGQFLVTDKGLQCIHLLNTQGLISARIDFEPTGICQLLERHAIVATSHDDVVVAQGGVQNLRLMQLSGNPVISVDAKHIPELEAQCVLTGTVDESGIIILGTLSGMIKIFKLL